MIISPVKPGSTLLNVQCDNCGKHFTRYEYRCRGLNFCKRACQLKSLGSGDLRNKIEKIWIDEFGGNNPSYSNDVKDKRKKTNIARRGVDHHWKDPLCQEEWKEKWFLLHGTTAVLNTPFVQEKSKQTLIEIYGVDNWWKSNDCQERNSSPEAREKHRATSIANWGIPSPTQSPVILEKINDTKKRNNSYKKSEPEDLVFKILCDNFGDHDIERQKFMNGRWPIDFYVKSINTYVQYDSYWHGYDNRGNLRDINEVQEFKTIQDEGIYRKMLVDKQQNEWFQKLNLQLVRIICDEYKNENKVLEKVLLLI